MPELRHLTIDEVGEITVVRFRDRRYVDGTEIEDLGRELYRLVEEEDRRKIVLDFSPVELFSSAAFGKLISLNSRVRAKGGALRLCNVPEHIFQVFRICKLDRIFDIRKDQSDALTATSK